MSVEGQYSRKLLIKSRDASNLCLSGVKGKEYWETHDVFIKGVRYVLKQTGLGRFHTVYDYCASHGFNVPYILTRNKAKYGIAYDIHPSKASENLWGRYPRLVARMEYRQEDIYQNKYNLEDNSLVIGLHACRGLIMKICDIAIQNNLPVIAVPCCIGKQDPFFAAFENIKPYDKWCLSVAQKLVLAGYDLHIRYIKKSATPVGTIIIGIPLNEKN